MGLIHKFLGVSCMYLIAVVMSVSCVLPKDKANYTGYDDFHIAPKSNNSFLGAVHVVNGARQCGGQGTFLDWRHAKCNSTTTDLCQIPANEFGRGEISFIPFESADSLMVNCTLISTSDYGTGTFYINYKPQNGTFIKGNEYTLSYDSVHGGATKSFTVLISISRPSDHVEELCGEAVFDIV